MEIFSNMRKTTENVGSIKRRVGSVFILLCMIITVAVVGVSAQGEELVSAGAAYQLEYGSIENEFYADWNKNGLTDGTAAAAYSSETQGNDWFALMYSKNVSTFGAPNGEGGIIIDLGAVKSGLNKFRVHCVTNASAPIVAAEKITVSVSDTAGGAFATVAEKTGLSSANDVDWFELSADSAASGRFVKFSFKLPTASNMGLFLLDELEVYAGGTAASDSSDTTSDTTSDAASGNESSSDVHGDPMFAITLANPGEYVEGRKFEVGVTIDDIVVPGGIYIISFAVEYDPAKVTLLNEESEDGSLIVDTHLPADVWENLSHVDRAAGVIEIEFSNPSTTRVAASADGDIALSFAFMPKDGVTGDIAINVKAGTVVAGDENFNKYAGRWENISVPLGHIPGWIEVEQRNCGHSGVRHCYCTVCGELLETEVLPPTGEHTAGEWVTTREARYGVAGSREQRCTVCGKVVNTELVAGLAFPKGDVNGNGIIDAQDYMMAKRNVIGNFTLDEDQTRRGDVDGNGKVDAWDYAKIKRHFLGTYTIE